ncbi:ABC transporter ATP-binding protein [Oenococcus kitaharae]|uniref:Putative hemin import ATP-binding protein HrtA n=1 Tax=Oenococcus kitaharae DSM 17330 TaxID=1045004 RepID=G9WFP7_9LACO|nr:ABC transporter ATP-binding protein [Oenococcus kitaharae]EHN59339.1 ABC transporter ATP-binding protein [Oenococcus kitaharae DSM 17330]OEY82149.1 peptide ABC transporter ATP-binding protein [Oenococcus kitaharae]OEY82572.1 peptide ABC transporter ATP-binding protein [Oenococcus kitaharae]OEY84827.1 peptide ABC transporter ATP-binding protein [Oenococcus kitaharae]
MAAIELKKVNHYFGSGSSLVHVLQDINFSAEKGQLVLIVGPSGSGKSTFLTIAGGLQTASSGDVSIEGQSINQLSREQSDQLRLSHIGFVLQSYALVPYLKVSEQLAFVDRIKPEGNLNAEELKELFAQLGIEDLVNKYPGQLSGGQRQRVAIARAVYTNPEVILADEPSAALDSDRVVKIGQLFKELAEQRDKAVVIVTHDTRLMPFADKIYEIMDGKMSLHDK